MERVTLFLFGRLLLSAPYDLFVILWWRGISVVFAFSPVLILLVSHAVSIPVIPSALFGSEQSIIFDDGMRTIVHRSRAGLASKWKQRHPFGMVARIGVRPHEWSDGTASRNIVLGLTKGLEVDFGHFGSKDDAERHLVEVAEMLGGPQLTNRALPIPH